MVGADHGQVDDISGSGSLVRRSVRSIVRQRYADLETSKKAFLPTFTLGSVSGQ